MARRGARLLLTGMAAAMALAGTTASAEAQWTVHSFPTPAADGRYPAYGGDLAAAPDGGVVRLANGSAVQHVDAQGRTTVKWLSPTETPLSGTLTALADGSMAFLTYEYVSDDYQQTAVNLVTLAAGTLDMRSVRLPSSGRKSLWDATAIAPDGSAWRARACTGVLDRTDRRGAETRVRIAPLRCRNGGYARYGERFAFGTDGSVWFGSLCKAHIVRIPLVGARREWQLPPRPRCRTYGEGLEQEHPVMAVTDLGGGVRFAGGRIDARGRLRLDGASVPDAVTPDGAQWSVRAQTITRRARGETARTFAAQPDGRRCIASAVGPDGRLWYLRAREFDGLSVGNYNGDVVLGTIDAAGRRSEQELPFSEAGELRPLLVPADGGKLWLAAGWGTQRVDGVPALWRPARPRAIRVIARHGATTWLQIGCSAPPGAFCVGSVAMHSPSSSRAVVRSTARFAVPSASARAIPLTLTGRALRVLRHGTLRVTAIVRPSDGMPTRRTLRLH